MLHWYSPLTLIVITLLFASLQRSEAQERLVTQGSIGGSLTIPIESFGSFSGVSAPDSIDYTSNGTSINPWVVVGADWLIAHRLRLGFSIGYRSYEMNFQATESAPIANGEGGITTATFIHDLSTSFTAIPIEPYLRFEPLQWLGLNIGIPLMFAAKSSYTQTVAIASPDTVSFVDGSKSQVTGNGNLKSSAVIIPGVGIKADYMLSLNSINSIYLTPTLGIQYQFGSWSSGSSLRSISFDGGIGVRILPFQNPTTDRRIRDTTFTLDTVVMLSANVKEPVTELVSTEMEEFSGSDTIRIIIHQRYHRIVPRPPAVLRASIALAFESEDGSLSAEARLRVVKIHRTRVVPILPVVLFDTTGTELPSRYVHLKASERRWNERSALVDAKTHWQYHVLNIVGSRMRDTTATTLNLICFDDGTDGGRIISNARLKVVKDYLCNTFSINQSRIHTESRKGQAAQQPWLFLQDTTRRLLQPITASDTISESTLPKVRITPEVVSGTAVRSWEVMMVQNDSTIRTLSGKDEPPATLVWDMNQDVSPDDVFNAPLSAVLKVEDVDGTQMQSQPSRIMLLGPTATEIPRITGHRYVVLRWIGADYLHTPDVELFGLDPVFTRIDVYPSPSRREDFFISNAPAVVHPIGADVWFRTGLISPERELFIHAEVYTNEKRRP